MRSGKKSGMTVHNRKFHPSPSPLEQEAQLDVIMPTDAQQLQGMIRMLDKEYENATPSQRAALDLWKMQVSQSTASDTVKLQFLRRFYFWLLGRGDDDATSKTLWGRGNAAAHNSEVAAYIDRFHNKRTQYAIQLFMLSQRVPSNLNQYYLYFKYVVNGQLKYTKLKDGTGFWDMSNEDYLEDFDLFRQAFDPNDDKPQDPSKRGDAAIIAPAVDGQISGKKSFQGQDPYPFTAEDRNKYKLDLEKVEQNAVRNIQQMLLDNNGPLPKYEGITKADLRELLDELRAGNAPPPSGDSKTDSSLDTARSNPALGVPGADSGVERNKSVLSAAKEAASKVASYLVTPDLGSPIEKVPQSPFAGEKDEVKKDLATEFGDKGKEEETLTDDTQKTLSRDESEVQIKNLEKVEKGDKRTSEVKNEIKKLQGEIVEAERDVTEAEIADKIEKTKMAPVDVSKADESFAEASKAIRFAEEFHRVATDHIRFHEDEIMDNENMDDARKIRLLDLATKQKAQLNRELDDIIHPLIQKRNTKKR